MTQHVTSDEGHLISWKYIRIARECLIVQLRNITRSGDTQSRALIVRKYGKLSDKRLCSKLVEPIIILEIHVPHSTLLS